MALRDNTIGSALDALETVLTSAELTSELNYLNTQLGFTLTVPQAWQRGAVAKFVNVQTPACLLYANTDTPVVGTSAKRDYHIFKVVIALAIGLDDVKDGATQADLHRAIVDYNDAMRRAVMGDVTATDPASTLRAAGVVHAGAFSTFYEPLEAGTTTSAPFVTSLSTVVFTQLRPSRTS